jgi:hypothetical protein
VCLKNGLLFCFDDDEFVALFSLGYFCWFLPTSGPALVSPITDEAADLDSRRPDDFEVNTGSNWSSCFGLLAYSVKVEVNGEKVIVVILRVIVQKSFVEWNFVEF